MPQRLYKRIGSMVPNAAALAIAASLLAPVPAMAFTLDGILSDGGSEYNLTNSSVFDLTYQLEGKSGTADVLIQGGQLRIGRDGIDGNIFMLVDVPISITDLVYGEAANTPLSGWNPPNHPFSKLEGSDKFEFELLIAGESQTRSISTELIKKVKKKKNDPPLPDDVLNAIEDDVKSDGGGILLDYATSLQYNLTQGIVEGRTGFGDKTNSPDPLDPSNGSPNADWVQAVQYEFEIDGSLFPDGETIELADLSSFLLHSSPTKGEFDNVVQVTCVNASNCDTVVQVDDTPEVPEPGSLALLGVGLVGFGLLRRRRRAS